MDFDYSISINILGMFLKMDTINALNAISDDEEAYICKKPWTSEIGSFTVNL